MQESKASCVHFTLACISWSSLGFFLQVESVKAVYDCRFQILLRCVILLGIKRCILTIFARNCIHLWTPWHSMLATWIPTTTLGMVPSMPLPDLGNSLEALKMLLGI